MKRGTSPCESLKPAAPAQVRDGGLLNLPLLYAERGSPKFEKAALRWLERYLTEGSPGLKHFAEITMDLAKQTQNYDRAL